MKIGQISNIKNKTYQKTYQIYHKALGTPAKKIWASLGASNLFIDSYFFLNLYPAIQSSLSNHEFATFALAGMSAISFAFFTLHSVTVPIFHLLINKFIPRDQPLSLSHNFNWARVTVQIPCRNEPFEVITKRSIASALKLDYPKDLVQILVIDNSDPGKYTELEKYCLEHDITFIHREGTEGGKSRNLNIALENASGEFIFTTDSDTSFPEDLLKKTIPEFYKDPTLSHIQFPSTSSFTEGNIFTNLLAEYNNICSTLVWLIEKYGITCLGGYGAIIRKTALEEIEGWEERKSIGEDWFTGFLLRLKGHKGKRVSYTGVNDPATENLQRFKIQQFRWAFGTLQTLRFLIFPKFIMAKNIPWNERISALYRLSFYPGIAFTLFFFPLLTIPFGIISQNENSLEFFQSFYHKWNYLFTSSLLIPILLSTYTAMDHNLNFKEGIKEGLKALLSFYPAIAAGSGAIVSIANAVCQASINPYAPFQVTPKGKVETDSFLHNIKQYKWEILFGLTTLITFNALMPTFILWHSFIGLSTLISPFLSWWGVKRANKLQEV